MSRGEWTVDEIDGELSEMLPRKDTLYGINVSPTIIVGVNLAFAINAASMGTAATAMANQTLASLHL
jgi:hypothetical protein